jgi:voltage-dependent calcium channel
LFDGVVSLGSLTTTGISQARDSVGLVMQQLQKLFMVLIAFKLVQRVDSLNKLFKTVRYDAGSCSRRRLPY